VIFATYFETAKITHFEFTSPYALAALFIGVCLPYLFSSFMLGSTATGAFRMADEVRRQFREIRGLREGKAVPDYAKCVDIAATVALREMVTPGVMAFAIPVLVGLLLGPEELGALMIGAIASAATLGFFFNNVGAQFDNAKKFVEAYGVLGSVDHKATIVGDTVGDPLKDVAGPSLLIFMKLLGMTSLLLLPIITKFSL
jgi:K(+)-stimulated pyrophosphate-energized sodium pump